VEDVEDGGLIEIDKDLKVAVGVVAVIGADVVGPVEEARDIGPFGGIIIGEGADAIGEAALDDGVGSAVVVGDAGDDGGVGGPGGDGDEAGCNCRRL